MQPREWKMSQFTIGTSELPPEDYLSLAKGSKSVVYHKYAENYVDMYMYKETLEALMTTNKLLRSRVETFEGGTKRLENVISNRIP